MNRPTLHALMADKGPPYIADAFGNGALPSGLSIVQLGKKLGEYYPDTPFQVRAIDPVSVGPQRLTRFPDCPLCEANVNDCRCDPDAYAAAVYARPNQETRK